jgi:hypothetical protein
MIELVSLARDKFAPTTIFYINITIFVVPSISTGGVRKLPHQTNTAPSCIDSAAFSASLFTLTDNAIATISAVVILPIRGAIGFKLRATAITYFYITPTVAPAIATGSLGKHPN